MIGLLAAGPSLLSGAISGKKKNIKKEKLLETKSSGGGGGALVKSGETGKNIKSSSALVKYQAPSIEKVTPKKSNAGGELNGLTVVINEIRSNLSQIRGFIAARKNASLKGFVEHKKSVKLGKAKKREKELETKKPIKGIGSKIKSIPGPGFSIGNFFTMVLLGSVLNLLLRNQKIIFKMFDDLGKGFTDLWTAIKFGIVSLATNFPKAIKRLTKFGKKLFKSKPVKMLGDTFKKLGSGLKKTFLKVGKRIGGFVTDIYKGVGKRLKPGLKPGLKPRGKPLTPFQLEQARKAATKAATASPVPPKPTPKPKGLRLAGRARAVFGKQGLKRLSKLGNLFKRIPFIGALIAIGIDLALGERLDNAIAGGIGASMGAWIGGAIGTGVLPIPFVGTFLGGVIGAAIGDWFGKQLYKKISGQLEAEVERSEVTSDQVGSEGGVRKTRNTRSTTGGTVRPSTSKASYGSPEMKALLDTLSFAEGNTGYSTWAAYKKHGPDDLTGLTIQEVHDLQTSYLAEGKHKKSNGGSGSAVVGRYQFLELRDHWAKASGLNPDTALFSPENQDRMAIDGIRRQGVTTKRLREEGLTNSIISALSGQWASFPKPGGGSVYVDQGAKKFSALKEKYNSSLGAIGKTQKKPGDGTFEGEIKRVRKGRGGVTWKKWKIDKDGEGSWWTQTGSHAVQAKKDWKKQQQQNSEPTATPDNSDKNLTKGITPSSASSSPASVAPTPSTASGTSASVSQQTSYGTGIRKRTVFYPADNNQIMGGTQSMSVGRVIPVMSDTKEALNRYHALQLLEFLYKNG